MKISEEYKADLLLGTANYFLPFPASIILLLLLYIVVQMLFKLMLRICIIKQHTVCIQTTFYERDKQSFVFGI